MLIESESIFRFRGRIPGIFLTIFLSTHKGGSMTQFDNKNEYSREAVNTDSFRYIGKGELGGKASGLVRMKKVLIGSETLKNIKEISVDIPQMLVILTDVFDAFMKENKLYEIALSDSSDDEIALAFQQASLPSLIVGDLMSFISTQHLPLAVRSSSLLEDSLFEPFAGVYTTKMIPNNQIDAQTRFAKLIEAIKLVYASTFFSNAKEYFNATGHDIRNEKMAVIIQEVIGCKYEDIYYPMISGVARSYNFYPVGGSKPDDGVISLALGLGKTIVEGEVSWNYNPLYPSAPPPYNSISELLKSSQTEFWAINLKKPETYDPIRETEYMRKYNLHRAEEDKTLNLVCSTYNGQSDRLYSGIFGSGPKLIDFAPILKSQVLPLNDVIPLVLKASEAEFESKVEIEFAVSHDVKTGKTNFGFLQARPMVVSDELVDLNPESYNQEQILLSSDKVMGNGYIDNLYDIVLVKRESFNVMATLDIAMEVGDMNAILQKEGKQYLLIGFGRWGTSDYWAGIPVKWGQISAAKVVIESTLPEINHDLSQGSHFFHNMTSFKTIYFSVREDEKRKIDWDWLYSHKSSHETKFVKHLHLAKPLKIIVDGRLGRGMILK